MDEVYVIENYGGAKLHQPYRVLKEGRDYLLIQVKGKPLYLPKSLINYNYEPPQEPDYEYIGDDFYMETFT